MSKLTPGTPVQIATTYKFPENNIASKIFPEGITPEHSLVLIDEPSNGRYSVLIPGTWHIETDPNLITWVNPMFRIPSWHFDKALVKA